MRLKRDPIGLWKEKMLAADLATEEELKVAVFLAHCVWRVGYVSVT